MRKEMEKMYGNLEHYPTYAVVSAEDGTELKSVTIIGNDECFDQHGFYQFGLSDDGKLYKAYYNLPECDDSDIAFDLIDYSKPTCVIDVTKDYL